ncbi:hypothetical protein ACTFIU_000157 [Dictyostelium citrinum]
MTVLTIRHSTNSTNTINTNNNGQKIIKIGFVSSDQYPTLSNDDKILIQLCAENNIECKCVVWDDVNMIGQWKKDNFDILIIRSLWDYVFKIDKFLKWMKIIKDNKIKVLNDLNAIEWNLDKNYLEELKRSSEIQIVPSIYIRKGENYPINVILREIEYAKQSGLFKFDQLCFVFKPTLGANGYGTTKFDLYEFLYYPEKYETLLNHLLSTSDIIVQPFINSVIEEGETSFVFFNGKFSHSIIKKPSLNDFRVQEDHGGTVQRNINPNSNEIQIAQNVINKIIEEKGPILYARIDMLRINGILYLSESEIFEPTLYFMGDTIIAKRFLNSIFELVK